MKKRNRYLLAAGAALACAGIVAGAGATPAQARDYAEIPHAAIGFKIWSYYLMDTENLTPTDASAKKANATFRIAYRKGGLRGSYKFAPLPANGFGTGPSLFTNGKRAFYLYGNKVYQWKLGTKSASESEELSAGKGKLAISAVAKGSVYLSSKAGTKSSSVYRYNPKNGTLSRVLSKGEVLLSSGKYLVCGTRASVKVKATRTGHYDNHAYRDVTVYQIRGGKLSKVRKLASLARMDTRADGYDRLVKKKLKGYKAHYYSVKATSATFKYAKVSASSGKAAKTQTYRF